MRRLLVFVIALGLFVTGCYVLIVQVLFSRTIMGSLLMMSGVFIGIGGSFLWSEFIAPAIGKKGD